MTLEPARSLSDPWTFSGRPFRRERPERPKRAPRRPRRERREDPRSLLPVVDPGWSPPVPLGRHLRLQARRGYRGAVVELQPGMFLVGEVPSEALQQDFGAIPLLATLLTSHALKALQRGGALLPPSSEPAPPRPTAPPADVAGWLASLYEGR